MRNSRKTERELLQELKTLRQRIAELEQSNCKPGRDGLRNAEAQFREIFENTQVGVYRTTPDGRILMANPALVRMLGYSSFEELAQRNLEEEGYEPQYSRSAFKDQIEKEGQVVSLESAWVKRDGTTLFVIENARAIRDEQGNTLYYEGTAENITERKKAEKALEESERRFRAIFDNAADGIVLADVSSEKYQIANEAFCRMIGCSPEEITTLGVAEIHPKEFLAFALDEFRRQVRRESTLARDVPVKRKDGSVLYADISSFPLALAEKAYLAGIFRDTTERRQAERKVRESEERLRVLMDATTESVLLVDRDLRILAANKTAVQKLGKSAEELIGKGPDELGESPFTRALLESRAQKARQVICSGKPVRSEDERAGMVFDTNMYPIFNEAGQVYQVAVFARDITEQKRLERALGESEEKYRTLVESAGEAIATIDRDGNFLFINKTGSERLGGRPGDYIGKTLWDAFPKEVADRQAGSVRRVIDTGQGMNYVVKTEMQGQARWYNTTIEPLRDSGGRVIAALAIGRDIHEARMAEMELEAYREKMAAAERLASIGTLSATLAHELTQPLTVITLSIEDSLAELEKTSCPQTVMEALRDSLSGVSNVTAIMERFRNFVRKSSEKTIDKVKLGAVAERIVKLLNKSIQQAGIKLHLGRLDELPPVYLNEKGLEQLFFALVQNAVQAAGGKEGRKLVIDGAVKRGLIELRFSDNCGGIQPENLDKIFEPFFTTKPAGEGTGLGLCIVQRVAERSGGAVRVENKPGEGATFIVTLGIDRNRM